jgi:hypothetical protein
MSEERQRIRELNKKALKSFDIYDYTFIKSLQFISKFSFLKNFILKILNVKKIQLY